MDVVRRVGATFGPYPATVLRVVDGDTLRVLADLGFNVRYEVDVRLFGCNAAELGTPAGDAAAAWLTGLLSIGRPVQIVSHGWDRYGGRADCAVILADGRDVVNLAETLGWVARWDGHGPRPVPAWPNPVPQPSAAR